MVAPVLPGPLLTCFASSSLGRCTSSGCARLQGGYHQSRLYFGSRPQEGRPPRLVSMAASSMLQGRGLAADHAFQQCSPAPDMKGEFLVLPAARQAASDTPIYLSLSRRPPKLLQVAQVDGDGFAPLVMETFEVLVKSRDTPSS